MVAAGYSLYTIDPGEHVDDEAERRTSPDSRRGWPRCRDVLE